jgi:hypothetical protein
MKLRNIFLIVILLSHHSLSFSSSFNEASTEFDNKNYQLAFQMFQTLANEGDSKSQYNVALMYSLGKGIKQDQKQAFNWYSKSAQQGNYSAQFELGKIYSKGWGVTKNNYLAFEWFFKAAQSNDSLHQYLLGVSYFYGHGVEKNYDSALIWVKKSAAQGNENAIEHLGKMYEFGIGLNRNIAVAKELYYKSGLESSKTRIDSINVIERCPPTATTHLFKLPFICITKDLLRTAMALRNLKPNKPILSIINKTSPENDTYNSENLLEGSQSFTSFFTKEGHLATLQYIFSTKNQSNSITQRTELITSKYGSSTPINTDGLVSKWILEDGVEIEVKSDIMKQIILLTYSNPTNLKQLKHHNNMKATQRNIDLINNQNDSF